MPIKVSPAREAWEQRYKHTLGELRFQLFCVNGHGVGDEAQLVLEHKFSDTARCNMCGAGKPFLYRWEVD